MVWAFAKTTGEQRRPQSYTFALPGVRRRGCPRKMWKQQMSEIWVTVGHCAGTSQA